MPTSHRWTWQHRAMVCACLAALILSPLPAPAHNGNGGDDDKPKTETPIKHVIVLIGENRSFDHVFATYVPKSRDSIHNLLSEGIIRANGTPGPNFSKAAQFQAVAPFRTKYFISLNPDEKTPYTILPQPTLNFAPNTPNFALGTPASLLAAVEPSLDADDLNLLTTGGTGLGQSFTLPDPDSRVQNFSALENGPFPLEGATLPYDS